MGIYRVYLLDVSDSDVFDPRLKILSTSDPAELLLERKDRRLLLRRLVIAGPTVSFVFLHSYRRD